jgi:hypothetical protein
VPGAPPQPQAASEVFDMTSVNPGYNVDPNGSRGIAHRALDCACTTLEQKFTGMVHAPSIARKF